MLIVITHIMLNKIFDSDSDSDIEENAQVKNFAN